jgi:hypothetical protein
LRYEDSLLELIAPWVAQGQLSFANHFRHVIHSCAPEVFARLDFDEDSAFLDPTLFSLAARGSLTPGDIALACVGAMNADRRPRALAVSADDCGRVFLPGLGYLLELPASRDVELEFNEASPIGYTAVGAHATALRLKGMLFGCPAPSLLPYPIPHLVSEDGLGGLECVDVAARVHEPALLSAVRRLETAWPGFFAAIARVTRHVMLFDDKMHNSFATMSAHGTVFLNTALGTSEAYFIEDLAHQCGHTLFSAAWEGSEPLLSVPPETEVSKLISRDDHRTLEVALHGMITQLLMVMALDRVLDAEPSDDDHEMTGRLLFAMVRLGQDLRELAPIPVYTEAGNVLIIELVRAYGVAAMRYSARLRRADFADQSYNFDYAAYLAHNTESSAELRR